MYILIQIKYTTNDNSVMQRGSFPLKGRKKEKVALDFFKWIQKENPFECKMEKVIVDGEDMTEMVKEMAKAPLN